MKPGSAEWHERLDALIAKERNLPVKWWYLSFAGDEGFLGGIFVEAPGPTSAVMETHRIGINPGGEVMAYEIPIDRTPPARLVNRLLTREEVKSG